MLFERIALEEDEKIIAIVRKHWWIITVETITTVVLALIPLLLYVAAMAQVSESNNAIIATFTSMLTTYTAELWFVYVLWLLVLWLTLANFWTDYYLDLWAITDRRVVLVDQRGFFRRFMSSFRLERLQDMNIEVNGILATLLDYGTIEAQTAGGSNERFISHHMPNPREIKATIVKAADELTNAQVSRINNLKDISTQDLTA